MHKDRKYFFVRWIVCMIYWVRRKLKCIRFIVYITKTLPLGSPTIESLALGDFAMQSLSDCLVE